MKGLDSIDLLSIKDLLELKADLRFYIAEYQRGYRWSKQEVVQLLKDIHGNFADKVYCLQPVPVLRSEEYFEVIDGQQRLTTLYLILTVLNKLGIYTGPVFNITYATRKSCISFLENIKAIDFVTEEAAIDPKWEVLPAAEKNVDNYHLHQTYQLVKLWLDSLKDEDKKLFTRKLVEDVKIIWYPIDLSTTANAKKLFRNINSGKIRLTSSDLIKALFVLQYQESKEPITIRNLKKVEFSNQWNDIEKQLNKDDFWFFINNGRKFDYPTRIALLFDLVTKSNSVNSYAAYIKYAENAVTLDWQQVIDVYRKIDEWFSDERYYHRIGFLINADIIAFEEIILLYKRSASRKEAKSAFFEVLNDHIESYVQSKNIETLSYDKNRIECRNILLLYNILLYEKDFPKQKFPFDLFVKEEWSLEHIHPQNPQDFKSIADVQFWLEDTMRILQGNITDTVELEKTTEQLPVVEKIQSILVDLKEQQKQEYTKVLKEKIREIKDLLETETSSHKLKNLTLLDKNTNSKLGNGLFKNKRDIVLKIANPGSKNYVPYGTVNCFVKRFTGEADLQNEFWSEADADRYFTNIKEVLNVK